MTYPAATHHDTAKLDLGERFALLAEGEERRGNHRNATSSWLAAERIIREGGREERASEMLRRAYCSRERDNAAS